jgi:glycosyltransferase involved in cell wall biosynthesis
MDLILSTGIDPKKVIFPDPYLLRSGISQEILATIYTGMDVYLGTSLGEGFGIGTIEAQACSTPVIVSDFAASAELCGDGWKIGGQPYWDAAHRNLGSTFHLFLKLLMHLTQAYNRGRGLAKRQCDFAKQYEADFVFKPSGNLL